MSSSPAPATAPATPETPWASGRVALVTGATSGFGQAFARRWVRAGGKVIATGRRAERLAELVAELGDACLARPLDVRDEKAMTALLNGLPEYFQAVDVLLNNAGLALGLDKAPNANIADWEQMIATNVVGFTRVVHAVLPGMVARRTGHVVNVGSVAGTYPYPGGNVYGATKAFVRQLSLNLRADLLGTGVRVTNIEPGMCETEFSVVRYRGDAAAAGKIYENTQSLSADDIAGVIEGVLRLPPHVNVNTLEVMPVTQAFGPFAVARQGS